MQRLVDEIVLVSEDEIRATHQVSAHTAEDPYRAERRGLGRPGAFQEAAAGAGARGRGALRRQHGLRIACQYSDTQIRVARPDEHSRVLAVYAALGYRRTIDPADTVWLAECAGDAAGIVRVAAEQGLWC